MLTTEHKCDAEQYNMLKRCSEKKDITEWNEWREHNPDVEIWLQGANLSEFYLKDANFDYAHFEYTDCISACCKNASFVKAHCENANFSCACCNEAKFYGTHCEKASFVHACCEGANFDGSYCSDASFMGAHCEGATFIQSHCIGTHFLCAHCERVNFGSANCQDANFFYTNCQRTIFSNTNCNGTNFCASRFNSETIFFGCKIDDKTNLSCTSLSSIMIEPGKRAKLEQNIRKFYWNDWFGTPIKCKISDIQRMTFYPNKEDHHDTTFWRKIYTFPVRLFWLISDYGYSTGRILWLFLFFIFFFATIYTACPEVLQLGDGKPLFSHNIGIGTRFCQMLTFATSTMVTLGFSNINVAAPCGILNGWGMLIVTLNLMVGYFMLAVLVTRLAVLFQTLAPGYTKSHTKNF